ncbi:MAG TPA: hypothetical protein VF988_17400 [Verrucomicrobiae bacterium]
MSNELNIDFKWLGRQSGSPLERAFYADIGLAVGEEWLTRLEDLEASTVGNHLRACAHRLATWFAANWWRLRWEPETQNCLKDADWRIAHSVASAGGGYVWPNIIFASDGDSLAVVSRPRKNPAPYEPIHYLNQVVTHITAAEFERRVDAFMASIISRQHSMNITDDHLPELWAEVQAERSDPEAAQSRKLEALCGYDPDEAPSALVETLIKDSSHLGSHALEEVAAQGRHHTQQVLRPILAIANSSGKPKEGGFRGTVPALIGTPDRHARGLPWQEAGQFARQARQEWNLGRQLISNKDLANLLGTRPAVFTSLSKATTPMPIALRARENGKVDFYINQLPSTSRRFATGRLIGDQLRFANGGRLFPATSTKTSRQQFQRAFAQEFLCPMDALLEKIQTTQPDENDISEAADYFQVSPLMVKTALVNHGHLEREALNWAD